MSKNERSQDDAVDTLYETVAKHMRIKADAQVAFELTDPPMEGIQSTMCAVVACRSEMA